MPENCAESLPHNLIRTAVIFVPHQIISHAYSERKQIALVRKS